MAPTAFSLSPVLAFSPLRPSCVAGPSLVYGGGNGHRRAPSFSPATYPVAGPGVVGYVDVGHERCQDRADRARSSGMSHVRIGGPSASTVPRAPRATTAVARSGLDVTNTPNMVMGVGGVGMNMNGADATARRRSQRHQDRLVLHRARSPADISHGAAGPRRERTRPDSNGGRPGCVAEPTFSQQINATQYVQSTSESVAAYATPALAAAAGYVAVSPTNYPVVYYVNPTVVAANAAAKRSLDPKPSMA